MFDLEKQVAEWRRETLAAGIKSPELLDELESHLRDDIEHHIRSRIEPSRAFEAAVQSIGQTGALKAEFKKVGGLKRAQKSLRHAVLTFAGVPGHYLDSPMNVPNANSNIEPGWATYLKTGAFIALALCLWCLSMTFVVPQVRAISRSAERRALPELMLENFGIADLVKDHLLVLAGLGILALILLEWRAKIWPRYRRATLGLAAFILNFIFLISLFLFFVSAALVATPAYHPVK